MVFYKQQTFFFVSIKSVSFVLNNTTNTVNERTKLYFAQSHTKHINNKRLLAGYWNTVFHMGRGSDLPFCMGPRVKYEGGSYLENQRN